MNWGLSEKLKTAFPSVVPVKRPVISNQEIPDPMWLAGFTAGEGCFFIVIEKSATKIGWRVQLVISLTQHSRDELFMVSLIKYFDSGKIYKKGNAFDFKVIKFDDILNKIIPFFKKYPIEGVKALDFADWCKAAELMRKKKHLTVEGLEQIRKIKAGMNTGRK